MGWSGRLGIALAALLALGTTAHAAPLVVTDLQNPEALRRIEADT